MIVGSSHTGRAGRVLPGSTGERLLHGSPCSVAVVPKDYRTHADQPIRRIGVAYNDTDEARAALAAGRVAGARARRRARDHRHRLDRDLLDPRRDGRARASRRCAVTSSATSRSCSTRSSAEVPADVAAHERRGHRGPPRSC